MRIARILSRALASCVLAVALVSCGRSTPPPAAPAAPVPPAEPVNAGGRNSVGAVFRHVNMHIDDAVVLEIQQLRGVMTPTAPGVIPTFDDPRSFTLDIESGEVALSPESLSS